MPGGDLGKMFYCTETLEKTKKIEIIALQRY